MSKDVKVRDLGLCSRQRKHPWAVKGGVIGFWIYLKPRPGGFLDRLDGKVVVDDSRVPVCVAGRMEDSSAKMGQG